jgi:hypothetical protein
MTHNPTRRLFSRSALLALSVLIALFAGPASAVTIPTVPVGNAGNTGEFQFQVQGTIGGVSYDYRIGTTEVTNAQYAEFLNFKAASDPLGLYNTWAAMPAPASRAAVRTAAIRTLRRPTWATSP